MINFYGGPKGENYIVSHSFGNTQELLQDLELGGASPVDLNEIVMISYGLPGSEKYEENMKKDYSSDVINKFYFTYNPYLEYYPSVEHHFGTNGHSKLYTILDERYESSYNGIKNMMHPYKNYCDICEDTGNRSVWIKINLTGKIKFNGRFIIAASGLQYDSKTSGITWHLASSIENARNGNSIAEAIFKVPFTGYDFLDFKVGGYFEAVPNISPNSHIILKENGYFVINTEAFETDQQLYAILEIHPQTAVDFTDFIIDRSGLQFNSYNFNSCLYQKVLKDTINYDDPFMYITFQGSNFAYKFLNSSIGSSPIINFNQNIGFVDSYDDPSIEKNIELSNSRHQIFDLKLPYPSTIKSNKDESGNTYLQLKYQETGEKKQQDIYMPTLNVAVNNSKDGLNITFITADGSSNETSITVVPEFDMTKDGTLSWRIKDSNSNYNVLGVIPEGPKGDKGDKGDTGETLQVTQQFSVTVESNLNNRISVADIAKTAFEMAMNKKYIDLTDIDQNYEVIIGGINYTNSTLQIQESYIMFFTLGAENNNNFTFTYDSKIIQFSYISVSDVGNNIKYISSTENKSLILNTSDNYNPEDKIYGAEGLTAGETNKIGTKVFDIIGYYGVEGGEGYYVLNINDDAVFTKLNDCISQAGSKTLRWSIRSQLNYDYAGEILGIEKDQSNNEVKLRVNNFFTNEVAIGESVSYTSGKTYNYGPRFNYCYPLGYYIDKKTSGDMSHTTDATLYICGYPKLGTRELYGQSYSFGKDNITQKDLSFQVGANNQGYNKYGITIGENNISGYGNAIFGRNINAGFAQMNISQGDYNTIGNYAKYDAQFGLNLNSNYDHQYQFGKFNKNKENNIIEVGYGTNDIRKNIFEIDKNGKIYSNEAEIQLNKNIISQCLPKSRNLISQVFQLHTPINQKNNRNDQFHGYYTIQNKNNILSLNHYYLLMLDINIESINILNNNSPGKFFELLYDNSKQELKFYSIFKNAINEFSNITSPTTFTILYPFEYTNSFSEYGFGFGDSNLEISYTYLNPRLYEINNLENILWYKENPQYSLNNIDEQIEKTYRSNLSRVREQAEDNSYKYYIENGIIVSDTVNEEQNIYYPDLFTDKSETQRKGFYIYSNNDFYMYSKSSMSILEHLTYTDILSYKKCYQDNEQWKIQLICNQLNGSQDVMISFNPKEEINLEDYKRQKEVYESIISNSYAKTFDNKVEIYILDPDIIDTSNTTECPILIKVV